MDENYTQPNNEDNVDKPTDWLFGALTFARALALTIPPNYGVVVDLQNDMIELYPHAKRVIIGHIDEGISVIDADERTDLTEGDVVLLMDDNISKN